MRETVLPAARLSEEPERSLRRRVFLKGEKWGKLSYHYVPTTLCRRSSSLQQRSERVLNWIKSQAGRGGTEREEGGHGGGRAGSRDRSLSKAFPSDGRTRARAGREGGDLSETWL